MPEAIATTKRKFYKALDSLNNLQAPNSSHATTTTTPSIKPPSEPVAKRVRRDISNTSTIGQPLQVTYLSRSNNADSDKKISTAAGNKTSAPNFSPWSHDAFLTRLKTFSSVSQWHPKPAPIGEVAWAKRGWICVGVNTVACRGGCEKRAVVDLTPRVTTNIGDDVEEEEDESDDGSSDTNGVEASLVQYYRDFIISGHAEGCLWRRSGCQDDIYHLQVVRPAIWQPALSSRFASINKVAKAIRDVVLRGIASSEQSSDSTATMSTEQPLACLPESLLPASPEMSTETRQKGLEIALHGWEGAVEFGNELLCCAACFQRIGLWMYQPGYKSRHRKHDDSNDAQDAQDDEEVAIDLLEMHREHCPWRNAETQMASGSLRGLNASQILQRVVATFAREQRRRAGELPSTPLPNGIEDGEPVSENDVNAVAALSKDEVARQDKERESRLQRLKNLLTIKRRRPVEASAGRDRPSSVGSKLSSVTSK